MTIDGYVFAGLKHVRPQNALFNLPLNIEVAKKASRRTFAKFPSELQ
jgi:hypothetical protein